MLHICTSMIIINSLTKILNHNYDNRQKVLFKPGNKTQFLILAVKQFRTIKSPVLNEVSRTEYTVWWAEHLLQLKPSFSPIGFLWNQKQTLPPPGREWVIQLPNHVSWTKCWQTPTSKLQVWLHVYTVEPVKINRSIGRGTPVFIAVPNIAF